MKIIYENLLNKILVFWDFLRGKKRRGREKRDILNMGLEKEVMREKPCWELPDLLTPLLACQMKQTTEY